MATYQRIFTVPKVGVVHRQFAEIFALAKAVDLERRALGLPPTTVATQQVVRRAYLKFNEELDTLAATTAQQATAAIRQRLKQTQVRVDTRMGPHLSGGIKSRPLRRFGAISTGEVGVADEDALNRVVNPTSPQYGPYWRAQEYGTGGAGGPGEPSVPSQVGRILYGFFYGAGLGGDPEVPRAQYAGGGGPHPIFVSASSQRSIYGSLGFGGGGGQRGGVGGLGTISKEIQARHFIRDGANQARAAWFRGIERAQSDAIAALRPVHP
jgi:hypothetical protein